VGSGEGGRGSAEAGASSTIDDEFLPVERINFAENKDDRRDESAILSWRIASFR